MTLFINLTETDDILILSSYNDQQGDTHEIAGLTYEHLTLVAYGTLRIKERGKPDCDIPAPAAILLPMEEITCEALTDTLLTYCIYNKTTAGSLDDVRMFVETLRARNSVVVN